MFTNSSRLSGPGFRRRDSLVVRGPVDPRLRSGVLEPSAGPLLQRVAGAGNEHVEPMRACRTTALTSPAGMLSPQVVGSAPRLPVPLPMRETPVPRDAEHVESIRGMRDRADRSWSEAPAEASRVRRSRPQSDHQCWSGLPGSAMQRRRRFDSDPTRPRSRPRRAGSRRGPRGATTARRRSFDQCQRWLSLRRRRRRGARVRATRRRSAQPEVCAARERTLGVQIEPFQCHHQGVLPAPAAKTSMSVGGRADGGDRHGGEVRDRRKRRLEPTMPRRFPATTPGCGYRPPRRTPPPGLVPTTRRTRLRRESTPTWGSCPWGSSSSRPTTTATPCPPARPRTRRRGCRGRTGAGGPASPPCIVNVFTSPLLERQRNTRLVVG